MRLRPLAAALVLALHSTALGSLPTLGAFAAGSLFIAAPRDAHAACDPSTPSITEAGASTETTCSGDLSEGIRSVTAVRRTFRFSDDLSFGENISAYESALENPLSTTSALTVTDPDVNIAPSTNVPGIEFSMKGMAAAPISEDPITLGLPTSGGFLALEVDPLVNISTQGAGAHGILVESQGSAGSDGDSGWTNTNGVPGTPGYAGGAVDVDTCTVDGEGKCVSSAGSQSRIDTNGDRAHGIFAQSRGGNGGNGESIGPSAGATGGNGGAGGAGGLVTVDNTANIGTEGDLAYGIFAQSVGGTGGDGGGVDAALSAAFGEGGNGGRGGDVLVTNSGTIETRDHFTNLIDVPEYAAVELPLIGIVNVPTGRSLQVLGPDGDGSHGIYARSRGGSAGDAGEANGIFSGGSLANLIAKLEARAEVGSAGDASVINRGAITASGNQSRAIFAESTGGNGGAGGTAGGLFAFGGGGSAAGHGGVVTVENTGKLQTDGDNASAILAESFGGGGGNGGGALGIGLGVSLAVGGGAEDGGDGGAVTVTSRTDADPATDDISTSGDYSNGIDARSIGGGGGTGGYATSLTAGVPVNGVSVGISVAIGGSGEVGGDAGIVEVDNTSTIATRGTESHGIFAESTGGGGGSGGASTAITATAGGAVNLSAAVSVGGSGGGGGNSANVRNQDGSRMLDGDGFLSSVKVASSGDITTGNTGKDAVTVDQLLDLDPDLIDALQAHEPAMTIAELDQLTSEELLAIPGIDVAAADEIATAARLFMRQDATSYGIYARGIGGGGGDGGLSVAGTLTVGQGAGAAVAVGGSGNGGGKGGAIDVLNEGNITTHGEQSHAIVAQSIGGGGGNGGGSVAGTLAFAEGGTGSVAVSVGGGGGGGGIGEDVSVVNSGSLKTNRVGSFGVLAQSIGGGGGNGGFSVAGSLSVSTGKSANIDVGVGGSGGDGNTGGAVEVLNDGDIETFADQSHAVFAQSVGGKGGNGGASIAAAGAFGGSNLNVTVSVGGSGGEGSSGGEVTVTNEKKIDTHGDQASGVFAQSIGGGGGTGGGSLAAAATFYKGVSEGAKNVNLDFSVGGSGGEGSEGGTVTVTNEGEIHTRGIISHGIFAESVGGGGGQGGAARSVSLIVNGCKAGNNLSSVAGVLSDLAPPVRKCPGDTSGSFNLEVGGTGGSAGQGGLVEVKNTQDILTEGVSSHGIFAQSIGGGGGTGGEGADGVGFPLIGLDTPKITSNVSLAIGGSGGASGDGGRVYVNHESGRIKTLDMASFGVFAQSVGGGGGQGGHGSSGLIGLSIGGKGGAAGDGGAVAVDLGSESATSTIETSGIFAHGVYAQSVGGGGGLGGTIVRGPADANLDANVGGITLHGGNAGSGGEVTVTSFGNITTGALDSEGFSGFGSMGIFAQSVGGGGGLAGGGLDNIFVLSGSAGGHGAGGDVTVHHTGSITTNSDFSHGIFAQSEGGSASFDEVRTALINVLVADATPLEEWLAKLDLLDEYERSGALVGGAVEVVVHGDVAANGAASTGIYAQSKGGDGNGDITVDVGGSVQGGSGPASAGVMILDGAENSLTIGEPDKDSAAVTTLDGVSGSAIVGGLGNETVNNWGTVTGSVDLGAGSNAFDNLASGRLIAGARVDLGAGGTLTNRGTFAPGGTGATATTQLTGDLVQTESGRYAVDADHAGGGLQTDRLDVSGTGDAAGHVVVNRMGLADMRAGTARATILKTGGALEHAGLLLDAPVSPLLEYRLEFPDPGEVALAYTLDFTGGDWLDDILNANQIGVGDYLNGVRGPGPDGLGPIVEVLLDLTEPRDVADAYERLSPESLTQTELATVFSSHQFAEALRSCPARAGAHRFVEQRQCVWARGLGSYMDQDARRSRQGFERKGGGLLAGAQWALPSDWFVGVGGGYDYGSLDVEDLSETDSHQALLGLVAKRVYGGTIASGSLSAGYSWNDFERSLGLIVPGATAKGDYGIALVAAHLRVEHAIELGGSFYLKPLVDGGMTYTYFESFDESGGGPANLHVRSRDRTDWSTRAALEMGGEWGDEAGSLIRPYVRAGATYFFHPVDRPIEARLEGAPSGSLPMRVDGKMEHTYYDGSAGLDVLWGNGISLRLETTGRFAEGFRSYGGAAKLSIPF